MAATEKELGIFKSFIPNKFDLVKIVSYLFIMMFVFALGWVMHDTSTNNYVCRLYMKTAYLELNLTYGGNLSDYSIEGADYVVPFWDKKGFNDTNAIQKILGK